MLNSLKIVNRRSKPLPFISRLIYLPIHLLTDYISARFFPSSSVNSSGFQSSQPTRLQSGSVRAAVGPERPQRHGHRLPPGPPHLHRPEHRRLANQRAGKQVEERRRSLTRKA